MKLYMYYLIDPYLINKFKEMHVFKIGYETAIRYEGEGKPMLYAFTSNKKNAKNFEASRNMDAFFATKSYMDDETYEYTISRSSCKIINARLRTSDNLIEIPVTENEAWLLERPSETMFDYLKGQTWYPPLSIFTGKVYEFLAQIGYGYVAECDQMNNYDYEEIEGMHDFQDEFGVFIYLFGDILNNSGLIDVAVAVSSNEIDIYKDEYFQGGGY